MGLLLLVFGLLCGFILGIIAVASSTERVDIHVETMTTHYKDKLYKLVEIKANRESNYD